MKISSYFRFTMAVWKNNLLNLALSWRVIVFRLIFLVVNNILLLSFWYIYFLNIASKSNISMDHIFALYGYVTVVFGLISCFFGNTTKLSHLIFNGHLDLYITGPRNTLYHCIIDRSSITGVADLAFGFGCLTLSGIINIQNFWILFFIIPSSICIFIGSCITIQSLSFWLGDLRNVSKQFIINLLTFSFYPIQIFPKAIVIILCSVIPAQLIANVPVYITKEVNFLYLLVYLFISFIFLLIGGFVFYQGKKKYNADALLGSAK